MSEQWTRIAHPFVCVCDTCGHEPDEDEPPVTYGSTECHDPDCEGMYTSVAVVPAAERDAYREALADLVRQTASMPDAGFSIESPRWDWWNETAKKLAAARAVLDRYPKEKT